MAGQAGFDALMAALPQVLAAPRSGGPVRQLCRRPRRNHREVCDTLTLSPSEGVAGDFGSTDPWLKLPDGRGDPRIQVSILSSRVLDLVWRDRDGVVHPGDPIIADLDLTEANLPAGSLLRVGTAVLRVSDLWNEGCAKWKVRYGAAAHAWVSDPSRAALRLRGVLCSIEQAGEVVVGDAIIRI